MIWGKWQYKFHLCGIRVPYWLYAELGTYFPYRARRVTFEEI